MLIFPIRLRRARELLARPDARAEHKANRMTDDSDSVVARQQSLQGFETVFPIEVISEIAPLCVGVGIGCRGGSLP
jgi:hypothetical protein